MKRSIMFFILVTGLAGYCFTEAQERPGGVDPSVFLQNDGGETSAALATSSLLEVKVTRNEMAEKPISNLLPGYLFEMGYGEMEIGMWAEMLYNRQFEPFYPYKGNHDWWYELREHSMGGFTNLYTVDWRVMTWYHSAYEHNAWYPAPGEVNDHIIHESSTFFHEKSGEPIGEMGNIQTGSLFIDGNRPSPVKLTRIKSGDGTGYFVRIINPDSSHEGGLGQNGKYLKAGMDYNFSCRMRRIGGEDHVKVILFKEKEWKVVLAEVEISGLTNQFKDFKVVLKNVAYEGFATFAIYVPPGAIVDVEIASLMPVDAIGGWRKDVIEMVRDEVKPGALRWPGGIFASFYDWQVGVGDRDKRPVRPSYHWGGFSFNDVGTLEYYRFCQETGAEPFICLNLFHPAKESYSYLGLEERPMQVHGYHLPQYTDIEKGAKMAADWVAYCNAPAGTHPMADLRAEHGHPKPLNIRYWELENEAFRFFPTAEGYAKACVVYSRAMKAIDPTIQLGICTYGDHLSKGLDQMLEIAGKHVDFLADRGNHYSNITNKIERTRAYGKTNNRDIAYANTEYFLGSASSRKAFGQIEEQSGSRNLKHASWAYALDWATDLMLWQRFGGDVIFTTYNSFVNDHLHSVFDTPREGVFIRYPAAIGRLFRETPASWPLHLEGYEPDEDKPFQVQVAWNRDRSGLVIYLLNYQDSYGKAEFDLTTLKKSFTTASTTLLAGPELTTVRTVKIPNPMVVPEEIREVGVEISDRWSVTTPPHSFMQIVLE